MPQYTVQIAYNSGRFLLDLYTDNKTSTIADESFLSNFSTSEGGNAQELIEDIKKLCQIRKDTYTLSIARSAREQLGQTVESLEGIIRNHNEQVNGS